jgi:hypothetical protein
LSKNILKIKKIKNNNVNFCIICGINEKLEYHQIELPKLNNKNLNIKKSYKNLTFTLCKICQKFEIKIYKKQNTFSKIVINN